MVLGRLKWQKPPKINKFTLNYAKIYELHTPTHRKIHQKQPF